MRLLPKGVARWSWHSRDGIDMWIDSIEQDDMFFLLLVGQMYIQLTSDTPEGYCKVKKWDLHRCSSPKSRRRMMVTLSRQHQCDFLTLDLSAAELFRRAALTLPPQRAHDRVRELGDDARILRNKEQK